MQLYHTGKYNLKSNNLVFAVWEAPELKRSVKSELTGPDVSTGCEEKKIIRLLSYNIDTILNSSSPDSTNKSPMEVGRNNHVSINNSDIVQRDGKYAPKRIEKQVEETKPVDPLASALNRIKYKVEKTEPETAQRPSRESETGKSSGGRR
jgi:hypothetical protein